MRPDVSFKVTRVVALALCLACTSCASTRPGAAASGASLANFEQVAQQYLPGTWYFQYSNPEPKFHVVGTSTYGSNGTATYKGKLQVQEQTIPLEFSANWSVRGNKMLTVVTESSLPQIVPVGTKSTDTIH